MILKSPAFLLKLKVSIFTTPLNTQRKSGGILLEVSILGERCSGCWVIHNKWCPWCRLPLAKFNTGTFFQLGCPFWSKIDLAMPITRALSNILQLQELHLLKYFLKMTLKLTLKDILFAYLYFYWIAPHKVFYFFIWKNF